MLPQADEECLRQVTTQGANGAILKTEPTDKLIRAIRAVAQGEPWVSQPLWYKITQPQTPPVDFSEAEKALLPLIVTEMTIDEIAETLHLSRRTACRQLDAICLKLNVTKRIGAAVQIAKRGLA